MTPEAAPSAPWEDRIFRTKWWLDAVAPTAWGQVVAEEDGHPAAQLAFVRRSLPLGLSALGSPPLTPWAGPWIEPGARDPRGLVRALIAQLPSTDYFSQNLQPGIADWLPFHWEGFTSSTRYTYVIEDLSDLDRVWRGMRDKTRNAIRKAERTVDIQVLDDAAPLVKLVSASFQRQGIAAQVPADVIVRAHRESVARGAGRAMVAADDHGNHHGVIFIVWDRASTYYLLGGGAPAFRNSQASSLLLWRAIQHAATVSRAFDFEGSMLPTVEPFFRGFGGTQVPYFSIVRTSRIGRLALSGREFLRAAVGHK